MRRCLTLYVIFFIIQPVAIALKNSLYCHLKGITDKQEIRLSIVGHH